MDMFGMERRLSDAAMGAGLVSGAGGLFAEDSWLEMHAGDPGTREGCRNHAPRHRVRHVTCRSHAQQRLHEFSDLKSTRVLRTSCAVGSCRRDEKSLDSTYAFGQQRTKLTRTQACRSAEQAFVTETMLEYNLTATKILLALPLFDMV